MTNKRISYVLTCDENTERSQFSKRVLEHVGFHVNFIKCIPDDNKVLSNKKSMLHIYEMVASGNEEWVYIFEDEINILEDIKLDEIIKYETISSIFFYLGVCCYNVLSRNKEHKIENKDVTIVSGNVRGLHAIALSKDGANELLKYSQDYENTEYMDMILEKFSEKYPANVVRYDLESYIKGHRGIFFQDRLRFPSTI